MWAPNSGMETSLLDGLRIPVCRGGHCNRRPGVDEGVLVPYRFGCPVAAGGLALSRRRHDPKKGPAVVELLETLVKLLGQVGELALHLIGRYWLLMIWLAWW